MRFNRFNEETEAELAVYDELIPQIKKKCQPWIHECGGGMLLRGSWVLGRKGNEAKPWVIVNTRTDRKPTDTPKYLHDIVDDVFEEEWGYRARSESVFCTSDWQTIMKKYGPSGIVIPIGTFDFLWSKKINDLWEDYLSEIESGMSHLQDWQIKDHIENTLPELYTSRDLHAAIKSGHEVMIKCKQYYFIQDTHTPKFRFRYKEIFK